jgi:hypothetical protein
MNKKPLMYSKRNNIRTQHEQTQSYSLYTIKNERRKTRSIGRARGLARAFESKRPED